MNATRILLCSLLVLPGSSLVHDGAALADEEIESLESAVDAHASRIDVLESALMSRVTSPPLAFEQDGGDLVSLHAVDHDGVARNTGGRLVVEPLVLEGLPGPLAGLIDALFAGRRFNGRVLEVSGRRATPLIEINLAQVVVLDVPAVGPDAGTFLLNVTVTPSSADLGFFSAESVDPPLSGTPLKAQLELVVGSLGATATANGADPLEITRTSGGRLAASNPVVRLTRADAGPLLTAFIDGRRLGDVRLRYLRPDGVTVLELTGAHARIVRAAPDYTGKGVVFEIQLEEPALAPVL